MLYPQTRPRLLGLKVRADRQSPNSGRESCLGGHLGLACPGVTEPQIIQRELIPKVIGQIAAAAKLKLIEVQPGETRSDAKYTYLSGGVRFTLGCDRKSCSMVFTFPKERKNSEITPICESLGFKSRAAAVGHATVSASCSISSHSYALTFQKGECPKVIELTECILRKVNPDK